VWQQRECRRDELAAFIVMCKVFDKEVVGNALSQDNCWGKIRCAFIALIAVLDLLH